MENQTKTNNELRQNAVYCTESDKYYISTHVHDFVSFESGGKTCFIDGGTEYRRISTPMPTTVLDWCIYADSPRELVKERALWGTYGVDGKDPLKYIPLSKCTSEHLENILKNCLYIGEYLQVLILEILVDRGVEVSLLPIEFRDLYRLMVKKRNERIGEIETV